MTHTNTNSLSPVLVWLDFLGPNSRTRPAQPTWNPCRSRSSPPLRPTRPPASSSVFRVHTATRSGTLPCCTARLRPCFSAPLPAQRPPLQKCRRPGAEQPPRVSSAPSYAPPGLPWQLRPLLQHRRPGLFVGHEQTSAAPFQFRFWPPWWVSVGKHQNGFSLTSSFFSPTFPPLPWTKLLKFWPRASFCTAAMEKMNLLQSNPWRTM